jgi:hypothetical protein
MKSGNVKKSKISNFFKDVVAHAVCYGMEFEGLGYEMVDIKQ